MPEWNTTVIGDVLTLQRGIDITKAEQRAGSVPVVSSGGIDSYHDTAAVAGPGVVIGRKGTLGTTFYLPGDYWPHDTTLWVRDFKGNLPRFVYYFFINLNVKWLDVGSANPTLNRNHVHPIRVRWPSRPIQERIAAVLGALDDKIAVNDRITTAGEDLAVAIARDTRWTVRVPLREVVKHTRDQVTPESFGTRTVAHYSLPAFDAGRLPELVASNSIKSNKFVVDAPSVLLSKLNPSIPRVWSVRPSSGTPALASTEFLVLKPTDDLSPDEIWAVCSHPEFTSELTGKVTGTSNSHQRVNPKDLLATTVVDPRNIPGNERSLIRIICERVRQARSESAALAELRDTLLPGLMSGGIRVRDAERAVEEAT